MLSFCIGNESTFLSLDLTEQCGIKILDTNTEIEEELKLIADEDDVEPRDVATFVPIVAQKITERETIKKSVEQRSSTFKRKLYHGQRVEILQSTSFKRKDISHAHFQLCFLQVLVTLLTPALAQSLLEITLSTL